MTVYKRYLGPLSFGRRFYGIFAGLILLFVLAYAIPVLFGVAQLLTGFYLMLVILDYCMLFFPRNPITADRVTPERLSNGDENDIQIIVRNHCRFLVNIYLIDELPFQFQKRDFHLETTLASDEERKLSYSVRPTARGEYIFYDINILTTTSLRLIMRRVRISAQTTVKVYPAFHALKKYDLVAWTNNLPEAGSRKIRKIGQSVEFEQIREYVTGDDIRTLNWKATARKGGQLMVNNYTDERSQQVYCMIDKGRVMKMPFGGMTLLDYAINATLILSRVVLRRQDRAGLITFDERIGHVIAADRKAGQMNLILETLYAQQTEYGESDYEKLFTLTRTKLRQRSLLVLFTNFESLSGLQRQLPFIRGMARSHLVLVVFFENTGLTALTSSPANDIESLYIKTIAEKFAHEKRLIARELRQHGIYTILTAPELLTINTVNKYLELKARQAL